jgi:hypothetical protein
LIEDSTDSTTTSFKQDDKDQLSAAGKSESAAASKEKDSDVPADTNR